MTTNQTIDGVPGLRELLERVATEANHMLGFTYAANYDECRAAVDELRALLDAPAVESELARMTRRCQNAELALKVQTENYEALKAAQPQGEPVAFTAVGVLRDDGDGGLVPEWILEGGTAELWAGAVLLVADEDQELCAEDGHCELYRAPTEQPAPVAVVPELTSELRWILGQMCFQHIHTAQALRLMGHQIARKAEDEQAVTIYWMLGHYLKDPANWRENASAEMKAAAQKA